MCEAACGIYTGQHAGVWKAACGVWKAACGVWKAACGTEPRVNKTRGLRCKNMARRQSSPYSSVLLSHRPVTWSSCFRCTFACGNYVGLPNGTLMSRLASGLQALQSAASTAAASTSGTTPVSSNISTATDSLKENNYSTDIGSGSSSAAHLPRDMSVNLGSAAAMLARATYRRPRDCRPNPVSEVWKVLPPAWPVVLEVQ